jgi:predicted esterase
VWDKRADKTKAAPLVVWLHGAMNGGYLSPYNWAPNGDAVWITPTDSRLEGEHRDPYANEDRYFSLWFGRPDEKNKVVRNITQARVVRYAQAIADQPQYNIDRNRLYIEGGSMGGGGALRIAFHHPGVFAAVAPMVPWINTDAWTFEQSHISRVFGRREDNYRANTPNGANIYNWMNMLWLAGNAPGRKLPPVVFFYRPDDGALSNREFSTLLQKLEANKYFALAEWINGGHKGPGELPTDKLVTPDISRYYLRFRKDEAYPAFAQSSNSDASDKAAQGQRNAYLDWSSSLHDLFPGTDSDTIIDTQSTFGITLKSLGEDARALVTIRNAQQFRPKGGARVRWTNTSLDGKALQNGTSIADADGLVTVEIAMLTAGNRLTLDK